MHLFRFSCIKSKRTKLFQIMILSAKNLQSMSLDILHSLIQRRQKMQNKLKLILWRRISPIFQNLYISYYVNTEEFAKSRTGTFVQEKPVLGNQFSDDPLLKKYLKKSLPAEVRMLVQGIFQFCSIFNPYDYFL